MTDEAVKELAAAIDRLATALEAVTTNNGLIKGIQIHHYGAVQSYPSQFQPYGPMWRDGLSQMSG